MFCTKCGREITEPGRFCTACGAPLSVPQQAPGQAPQQAPGGVLYEGAATWNQGGFMYSGCYLLITPELISIFKNKRAFEKRQPLATIPTGMMNRVDMGGNMNGPYITVRLTDGKLVNFRHLFHMDDIHRALYIAGRAKNPQWFK